MEVSWKFKDERELHKVIGKTGVGGRFGALLGEQEQLGGGTAQIGRAHV